MSFVPCLWEARNAKPPSSFRPNLIAQYTSKFGLGLFASFGMVSKDTADRAGLPSQAHCT